jgi:hypothetical protein
MALPPVEIDIRADTDGVVTAERGFDRVSKSAKRMGAAVRNVDTRSASMGRGIQNAAFQVGDFAVQVGAGTSASRALAMQLPQLLGGFGVLGAVMGATAAIAVPLAGSLANITFVSEGLAQAMDFLNANLERIIAIAATGATLFAGKFIAGFVAARIATMSLAGALTFLRGALIRTGIGALVVAAGELVYQFSRLVRAAGGFGEALGLIWDVGKEAFGRLGKNVMLLKTNFQIVINEIEYAWVNGLGKMQVAFARFLDGIAERAPAFMGLEGGNVQAAMKSIGSELDKITAEGVDLWGVKSGLEAELDKPYESISKIRELLANMKDNGLTLDGILGLGGDDDEDGGDSMDKKLKGQYERIKEHLDRVKALTMGTLSDKMGAWGDYFSNLITMTGTSSKKVLAIAKTFTAAQALIDAWGAYNKALNSPTPMAPWTRLALAAQVLAAGLGAVSSIKGVTSSGGGSAGGTASGGAAAAAAPAPMQVSVSGLDDDALFSGKFVSGLLDKLQDEAGDRGLAFV